MEVLPHGTGDARVTFGRRSKLGPRAAMSNTGVPEGAVPVALEKLVAPHIESFDYFLGDGMLQVVQGLEPVEVRWQY